MKVLMLAVGGLVIVAAFGYGLFKFIINVKNPEGAPAAAPPESKVSGITHSETTSETTKEN